MTRIDDKSQLWKYRLVQLFCWLGISH